MKRIFSFVLAASIFSLTSIQFAHATPIADQSIIEVTHFDYSDSSAPEPAGYMVQSTASSFSDTYISTTNANVESYGNLATGKVGSIASGTIGTDYQTGVSIYDTLSFSTASGTATNVSFNYSLDGVFSSYLGYKADAALHIRIYDITGLANWLEDDPFIKSVYTSFAPYTDVDVVSGAVNVFNGNISFGVNTSSSGAPYKDLVVYDAVNNAQNVSMTKTGSFLADPTKIYGIAITSTAFAYGAATADFLNTGTFTFTDLNGASFQSASGVFLSDTAADIPEPNGLLLLGLGLIGLVLSRRNKLR